MTVHPSKKHLLVAAAILASGAVIVPMRLASPKAIEAAPPPPTVLVSPPMQRRVTGTDTYTGRFDAVDSVEVRPRVSGYIDRVEFRDGDLVTKGQLLFVIDPRPYQAQLAQAEGHLADARSQLALANAELQRAKVLIESGTFSQSQFDQKQQTQQAAQAAVTVAGGMLAAARLNLAFTEVRAPMSGRIGRHAVSVGNLVQTGAEATLLTSIVSTDPIDLYFDIDEGSFLRYGQLVRAGQRSSAGGVGGKVSIALPGQAKPAYTGTLDFTDNRLDRSTGTLRVRARVSNPDGSLTPGQFGRVVIEGDAPHDALLVAETAVISDATDKVLDVVGADDKVEQRTVVLGGLFGEFREIRSGLKRDDRVIVAGFQHAESGDKVVPQPQTLNAGQLPAAGGVQ